MNDRTLETFAAAAGLEVNWTDAAGKAHKVSPEVLRRVLGALGYPADTEPQVAESTKRLEDENRQVAPLLTAWCGTEFSAAGQVFRAPDSPGYHAWEINGAPATIAAAPRRCFAIGDVTSEPIAGLGVQLYALRGGHSGQFGDFAALAGLASSAAAHGIDALAISPVHALFAADPSHISPYSPSSRVLLNPLYGDAGIRGGRPRADDGMDGLIDWPAAAAQKYADLAAAYQGFDASGDDEFIGWCAEQGDRLYLHALFEVLDKHFRGLGIYSWGNWPDSFHDPAHRDVLRFAVDHRADIEFHHFAQFIAAKSLSAAQKQSRDAGMKIGIIADLATGIDPNGSDCWGAPDEVLNGLRIGAPPDLFNAAGQNWGITALSPLQLRKTGFKPFIALLQANMRHAGGIRIDHAMGLMRLWVVPEGESAADGVYLRYPLDDLLRLISLESHSARAIVIGEDLGTVPDGFSEMLAGHGISGMQVLWFEHDKGGRFIPPARWRRDAVAMTTTHDLPTVAGWWAGRDIDWRAKFGIRTSAGDESAERAERKDAKARLWSALQDADCVEGAMPERAEPVIEGAAAFVGETPSRLAILQAEDACGLEEQPNFPGTIDQHPNWRRRLPPGELFGQPQVSERIARLVHSRRS